MTFAPKFNTNKRNSDCGQSLSKHDIAIKPIQRCSSLIVVNSELLRALLSKACMQHRTRFYLRASNSKFVEIVWQ